MSAPTSVGSSFSSIARAFSNPFSSIASAFGGVLTPAYAQAEVELPADFNPFGIVHYGYELNDPALSTEPDTGKFANCDGVGFSDQNIARDASLENDPDDEVPWAVYTVPNYCALERTAVEAANFMYSPTSDSANIIPSIDGLEIPPNYTGETMLGYSLMPDSPNNYYQFIYPDVPLVHYGSPELIGAIYTASKTMKATYPDRNFTIWVGDLNDAGHITHLYGTSVDLHITGDFCAADHTGGCETLYDRDATVAFGMALANTGVISRIIWCEPGAVPPNTFGDDGSMEEITSLAGNKLDRAVYCYAGHDNHFHVDVKSEYAGETAWPWQNTD